MLVMKWLGVFSFLLATCYGTDPTQTPKRLHPGLFFSNKPALQDSLGRGNDNAAVTLSCIGGSGDGRRVYFKWYKSGSELTSDSFRTLTTSGDLRINPTDHTRDDGYYQCLITDNTWSVLSNSAELRLAYINGVTKRDVTVYGTQYQGWKYVFDRSHYSYSEYPKPKFIWKFKGRTLRESNRISISAEGNLYIAQLSLDDAGKYTFEMELGSLKQQRESVTLQVATASSTSDIYATVMFMGPRNHVVGVKRPPSVTKKDITFECFATGKPMPTIKWKKVGGSEIQSNSKYVITDYGKRLTIKNLIKSDTGRYQCTITRAASAVFPEANLKVVEQPEIKALEPENQVRHIGNFTTLTCMVTGSFSGVRFSVKWYRNGIKLSKSSKISWFYRTHGYYRNYTLNVTKLNKDNDGGMYQCFAQNDGGSDMAYTAINVQTMPPYIWYGPGDVYAEVNRPVKIVCKARGSPPITYTWEKNGRKITNLNPRDNGKNGTYVIRNVGRGDVAQYTCIASNGKTLADTYRSTGRLELVSPTVVVNKSITVYASKGSDRYIYCGVRYDRKINVTYKWYFKDQLIERTNARYRYGDWGRLIINGVFERDNGIYRCESTSSVGHYSTTVELVVQAPPYEPRVPTIDLVRPASVRLLWQVSNTGNSPIQYYKIGQRFVVNKTEIVLRQRVHIFGDVKTTKAYEVPGLTPYTRYQFRVQAWNFVGASPWSGWSKEVETRQAAPSYKLKTVEGKAVDDDTIEVKWEEAPRSTHNGVLRGYYVAWKYAGITVGKYTMVKVTPATTRKAKITNLILNSPYEVKVQLFNDAGGGPFSDPVLIRTKEGIPSSPPRNLAVRNVSSRSVLLEWDDPPQQDWNGKITRYIIRVWETAKNDEKDFEDRIALHDPSTFTQVFNVTNLKTFTQYKFEVSAQNSVGGSPFSKSVQVKTTEDIPSAPQRLQIVDQFSDTISVKWVRPREVNGVLTGYVVEYWRLDDFGDKAGEVKTVEAEGGALQTGITNLRAKSRYKIRVAARTNAGVSDYAEIEGRTQDVAVRPREPSQLRLFDVNATSMQLTWKEGFKGHSPIIKYLIEGNNETGFANDRSSKWFTALIVIDPFKIYNLPPVVIGTATIYRFRVRAENKVGVSAFSNVSAGISTADARPWSPPVNIRVSPAQYPGEFFLYWNAPPKETWNSPFIKYTIVIQEEGEHGNFTKSIYSGIRANARRFRLTALLKYTSYEIRMKTVNELGDSPFSPVVVLRTQEYVPGAAPHNIRAIGTSGSSIEVSWDEVLEESRNGIVLGYKLFYRLVQYAPHDFTELDLGNVKLYTLKNLLGYTHYDIRVLAYTKIGDGKLSDRLNPYPRTLETKPGPPSNLRFPTVTQSVVVVNWAPPEMTGGNITHYRVSYKLRDDGKSQLVTRPSLIARKRSDSIPNLSSNKFYIFNVQAYTAVGWGEEASAEIFTSRRNTKKPERPIILPISDSDITWRSIKVRWAVGRRRDQPIRYFTLRLRKPQGAWEIHPKPLSGTDSEMIVWGLQSNHFYTFEITATNDAGTSPPSAPSPPVRTFRKSTRGSPRDVRIMSPSSTSLTITWKPPSLVDIETTIKEYRLGYRLHEINRPSNKVYLTIVLSAPTRKYELTGLEEYTLYDIKLEAVDVNFEYLPAYLETRRTSAERPRRPSLNGKPSAGPTFITLSWGSPGTTKTPILGYKAEYKIPSRRRRAVREHCETPQPGSAYFSNTSTSGTITGLQMYTSYVISLKSFNTAGDSDPSNSVSVRTAEGVPGPPAVFDFDGVYDIEVHIYWERPCQPNGVIENYVLTVSSGGRKVRTKELSASSGEYKVLGLARARIYKFELVAETSKGKGIAKVLEAKTKSVAVKPSRPKITLVTAENDEVTLSWRVVSHGNTPITKYIIEYRSSTEKNPWVTGWRLDPSDTKKNRTSRTFYVVLRDLEPNTVYWFRMKLENKIGFSEPSDSSPSVSTGPALPEAPSALIYEEIWFISVMAVIGFLIILFLIICICLLCRRRRRRSKHLAYPIEMETHNSLGHRPYSSFDETLSNGGSKTHRDEKPLVDDEESEQEGEEEQEEDEASSLETKSDIESDESSDDISTKKQKMEKALREQDKYRAPKSYSTEQLHNSPPPAYATFASNRGKGRSEPFLDPFGDFDDDINSKSYQLPYRPPTRRSAFEAYDGESSESSEIANRKRGDPRSSSFRRALVTGGPSQPEPERPYEPNRRPQPRKYRSLEKAVNENTKPPSYHDDDDDDDDSHRPSLPPEYRSDSGRESSDDHERIPLTQANSRYEREDRSESPAPEYYSDDSSGRRRLTGGGPTPQPEISSYSSFV
ncbi:protein sidekick-1-like [Dendronephthya gigantea]|uniref:protein sidekick-1-like n=1 Tax=Dendronephthya gigantea TaxID=151771 RepID=UPI00106BFACE|nr:protein sidekick-1-like [Dendronephthya gigantea]